MIRERISGSEIEYAGCCICFLGGLSLRRSCVIRERISGSEIEYAGCCICFLGGLSLRSNVP